MTTAFVGADTDEHRFPLNPYIHALKICKMRTVRLAIIKTFLLTILNVLFFLYCTAQSRLLDSVHRIVFLGNSITYAGSYITDIETYFITHYPNKQYEFINMGLPSETVSGLS